MKKSIIALLLIAMLVPFASCGSGGTTEKETSGNAPSETSGADTTADSETTLLDYPDNLPDMDFGGKTYTVLGEEGMSGFFHADELTGEVVNDALYNRDVKVGERFNAKITLSSTCLLYTSPSPRES